MRTCPNCGFKEHSEKGTILVVLEGDYPSRIPLFRKIFPHYWDILEQKPYDFSDLNEAKALYEKVLEFLNNAVKGEKP
jgi:hypothetical protein